MKIHNIQSYTKNELAGISADIHLLSGKTYTVFYEVEKKYAHLLSCDGTSFLAAMLPIGMLYKEDIEVDDSVSTKFMSHTKRIMKITESWNHGFHPIMLNVKKEQKDTKNGKFVGSFFSGGADSYYTYIKNRKKINSLVFVHGFDIKVSDFKLYSLVEKNIAKVADSEKVTLVKVRTNLREMYDHYIDWDLAHGFAIGSVALSLRNGFSSLYVSCGLPAKHQDHHSLTPDLDPLWSAEKMRMVHYGCNADKLLKLKVLAKFPIVMETLRVCWMNKSNAYNCCTCEKCMRNMIGLYVCDSLEKCKTFDKALDLEPLKKVSVRAYELKYYQAILDALDKKGDKTEVQKAIKACIVRNSMASAHKKTLLGSLRIQLRMIDKRYNKNRVYWFLANRGLV